MRKAILTSAFIHLALVAAVMVAGWRRTTYISLPSVYQVQLIAMPDVQAAPPEDVVEQVEAETIPPPPEEKKRLKPKPKKEKPTPQKQTQQSTIQGKNLSQVDPGLSGMRSDEVFEYPYYLRIMVDKISRNWINPYSGREESVVATIYFRVGGDGTISDARVETSSGVASFDRAALRAVFSSNPLPPLPADYSEPQLTVHLDFEYKPQ
ncbi:TonB family protein [bacterium]|nr:TonB family protein [bacterium]